MSTREQLAEVIRDGVGTWRTPLEAADAILAGTRGRPMTPEQAQRLGELHEAEVQARWEYTLDRQDSTWNRVQDASRAFYTYLNSITERSTK